MLIKLFFFIKVLEFNDNVWLVMENYKVVNDEEILLKKGQFVEVFVKLYGSLWWRVCLLLSEGLNLVEGWVLYNVLKCFDECDFKKKWYLDIFYLSSEGKLRKYEVFFVLLYCVICILCCEFFVCFLFIVVCVCFKNVYLIKDCMYNLI